jgi:sugar transferase (PEP-CTERM/EpsH1 system associated)
MNRNSRNRHNNTGSQFGAGGRRRISIAHIIYRLDFGGLENGLVNLINNMSAETYRHTIICLQGFSDFKTRIRRQDVDVYALDKREGKDFAVYFRLWKLLRKLKPDIVHTRNLAALDGAVVALLAGVKNRIHSEHGWDMVDLHGRNRKYTIFRKLLRPVVCRYIALSRDQAQWMLHHIGIPENRLLHIYNGVDTSRFLSGRNATMLPFVRSAENKLFVIGTVGRMEAVKNQQALAAAFVLLLQKYPALKNTARLVMIGDGSRRVDILTRLQQAGLEELVWLPGSRNDIPELMAAMDLFVLPSLNEGISNTILEAMASGLPVIATGVGGNPELVDEGRTGYLVPPSDTDALAGAMSRYLFDDRLASVHGAAGRYRVEEKFSLKQMVERYQNAYETLMIG